MMEMTSFNVQPISYLITECVIRIGLSFVAGIVLGLERKFRQQVVGMRTLILISISSCLLGMLSFFVIDVAGGNGDPSRIDAGVVSGIGFLGAGAILRQGLNIKGLTSAAIIWTACSVGLSLGCGLYIPAIIVLVVALLSLLIFEKIEGKWFPAGKSKTLRLIYNEDTVQSASVRKVIESHGLIITDFNLSKIFDENMTILHYTVKSPKFGDFSKFVSELKEIGKLSEFSMTD